MQNPLEKFDTIRPFEPEELPGVYDRLLNNTQFQAVIKYLYPEVPLELVAQKMRTCHTGLEFQRAFCYDFVTGVMAKHSDGYTFEHEALDLSKRHTFVSNHRDIVIDSALLDVMLVDAGSDTTCEIAIGDNLLGLPWVKDFVRVNKSFIVKRGLPLRETLIESKRLAEYMHYAITQKQENIWIAQRSGRAKDSDDRTSEAVLKMMTMGGEGTVQERICQLHIVPLSISYEFDPCDFLKAQEFQLKRDNENWKKSPTDDLVSMQTGIFGYKGRVVYRCSPCIDTFIDELDSNIPKDQFYSLLAAHIDREIHRNYQLFPNNFVAWDELTGEDSHHEHYTEADKERFDQYMEQQLAKIDMPGKDLPYLRKCMLTMYANPAINHYAALS